MNMLQKKKTTKMMVLIMILKTRALKKKPKVKWVSRFKTVKLMLFVLKWVWCGGMPDGVVGCEIVWCFGLMWCSGMWGGVVTCGMMWWDVGVV